MGAAPEKRVVVVAVEVEGAAEPLKDQPLDGAENKLGAEKAGGGLEGGAEPQLQVVDMAVENGEGSRANVNF